MRDEAKRPVRLAEPLLAKAPDEPGESAKPKPGQPQWA
jgi:hypothetical protein